MYDKLNTIEKKVFDVLALMLVLFYTCSALVGPFATQYHRGFYVLITYILVFLIYKSDVKLGNFNLGRIIDLLLMALSIFTVVYWINVYECRCYRYTPSFFENLVGILGVVVSIEVVRRVTGPMLAIIGIVLLSYGAHGLNFLEQWAWVPEWLKIVSFDHGNFPEICYSTFYKTDGIFGIMANTLPYYIIMFLLFGAFMEVSGARCFFIDFPMALLGKSTGGAEKASIITSCLSGSILDCSFTNTAPNVSYTTPKMKQPGFPPHIANALEPASWVSRMLAPFFMGACGFLMAELAGVPYSRIMIVAVFPTLMYIFSLLTMIHFEAKIHGIKEGKSNNAWEIFKAQWFYAIPPIITTCLILIGFSVGYSAAIGIAACIIISHKNSETRIDLTIVWFIITIVACQLIEYLGSIVLERELYKINFSLPLLIPAIGIVLSLITNYKRKSKGACLPKEKALFMEATRKSVENSLKIGAPIGVIGIATSVLAFSGLALDLADLLIDQAGGSILTTIIIIAFASMVLSLGLPVIVVYMIMALITVPALTHLGINEIGAHMVVFWLCLAPNITPPFCIPAFSNAPTTNAKKWKTALVSLKFGQFLFIGPLLFGFLPVFSLACPALVSSEYLKHYYEGCQYCQVPGIVLSFALIPLGAFIYAYIMSFHWFYCLTNSLKKKRNWTP